jgi:hypothetical protein
VAPIPTLSTGPLTLVIQLVVFAACYFTLVPILRGIGNEDVGRLRLVLSEMRAVGVLSGWVLGYEAFIIERLVSRQSRSDSKG